MTMCTITLSTDDLAALRAIRPVIADAHAHPGRAAAIAALDRIADQVSRGDRFDAHVEAGLDDLAAAWDAAVRPLYDVPAARSAAASSQPPGALLDFIERAWPTLHPDRPFERWPIIETLFRWVEQLASDPAADVTLTRSWAMTEGL